MNVDVILSSVPADPDYLRLREDIRSELARRFPEQAHQAVSVDSGRTSGCLGAVALIAIVGTIIGCL